MKSQWNNRPGTFSVEIYTLEMRALDIDDNPLSLLNVFCFVQGIEYGELVVNFLSSGYYDPGKTYGLPENCYPPEGNDERELDDAYIDSNRSKIKLPPALAQQVFDHFYDEINEVEIDNSPDEPDYDEDKYERSHRYV